MADHLSKADFNAFRRVALEYWWPVAVGPAPVPAALLLWLANPTKDDDLGTKLVCDLRRCMPVLGAV
jgi:hypothetical protein